MSEDKKNLVGEWLDDDREGVLPTCVSFSVTGVHDPQNMIPFRQNLQSLASEISPSTKSGFIQCKMPDTFGDVETLSAFMVLMRITSVRVNPLKELTLWIAVELLGPHKQGFRMKIGDVGSRRLESTYYSSPKLSSVFPSVTSVSASRQRIGPSLSRSSTSTEWLSGDQGDILHRLIHLWSSH